MKDIYSFFSLSYFLKSFSIFCNCNMNGTSSKKKKKKKTFPAMKTFQSKNYEKLVEDEKIRKYVSARIPKGGISKIVIAYYFTFKWE